MYTDREGFIGQFEITEETFFLVSSDVQKHQLPMLSGCVDDVWISRTDDGLLDLGLFMLGYVTVF